jgi:hypothetical protein
MTDWRTDEEIEQDRRDEPGLQLEFALLLIGFGALLLRGLGLLG